MKLDILDCELKEVYQFIQVLLGGEQVDVDIKESEIKILMRKALKDYAERINNWFILNNFSNVQGYDASTNFTYQFVSQNPMIAQRISDWFASMTRTGGKVQWHKDYFFIESGRQIYDLSLESSVPYKRGERRIHRIMWVAKPEIMGGQFDPSITDGGLTVFGSAGLMYGQNLMSYLGTSFDVVLLAQSLETRNKILRSEFFYNISGDIVEVTPMPGNGMDGLPANSRIYYYYVNEDDMLLLQEDGDDKLIANPTQVQLDVMKWSDLNSPSKNWIENWTLMLAKYMFASKLRAVRKIASGESEYQIEFDYQTLLDESKAEKEKMLEDLKLYLDELLPQKQFENKFTVMDNSRKINNMSPRKVFIGSILLLLSLSIFI